MKTEIEESLLDITNPVAGGHVPDCIVKAEGLVHLSESATTQDVSGNLKIESDGDADWQDLDSDRESDGESAHDSIAPTVVDIHWSIIRMNQHSRLRYLQCRLYL